MPKLLANIEKISQNDCRAIRMRGIGGSDAPIICGVNRYKSPVELWMEKTGKIQSKSAGEEAYWGNVLEPIILHEFEKRTGLEVGRDVAMLQHDEYPFMMASLDGIVYDKKSREAYVFEAKTASSFKNYEWDNAIPDAYFVQVQHYMAVTGLNGAFVAVLIGGNHFKYFFIPRDDEVIAMIIKMEKDFWDHVVEGKPPIYDGSEALENFLDDLYPKSNSLSIELPDNAFYLVCQYEQAIENEKLAQRSKMEAGNKLKALLGEHETGRVRDCIVSWKTVEMKRLDSKRLKADNPDIYSEYSKKTDYRKFEIR